MRIVYLLLLIAFIAVVAVFAVQNLHIVELQFLRQKLEWSLAVIVVGAYVLGALTGGGGM